jgi:threonyl-tRNA synthetase
MRKKVLDLLENNEIRALVDNRNETIGKKIRDAEMQNPVYADCRRGKRKTAPFLSVATDRKEKETSALRLKSLLR